MKRKKTPSPLRGGNAKARATGYALRVLDLLDDDPALLAEFLQAAGLILKRKRAHRRGA